MGRWQAIFSQESWRISRKYCAVQGAKAPPVGHVDMFQTSPKKQAIEAEKLTGDNIYKVLIYFDQLYGKMNDREKRQLIEELISEIQIYPERQPNGQWLKSIKFRLPIIEEDMNISLDNEQQVETIVPLQRETS